MYDQVGGGFARYSVDERWLVPHFEKMLYDNALLARAYLHGWQVTGDPLFRRCARRRSTGRCARCAARRAASTPRSTPTPRARRASSTSGRSTSCARWRRRRRAAIEWFGATDGQGNFEGANILTRGDGEAAGRLPSSSAQRLYDVRSQRVWPGLDDKRLTSWNALMIAALAEAGAVLERADYLDAARGAPSSCCATCATTTAGCCAPTRTARPS